MLKRLYLADGTLQTALSKSAEDISVDAGLATYLAQQLGISDWAYLTIEWSGLIEVVKVYMDYSGLNVTRAQDGTCTQAFPVGATVKYRLTRAEIEDYISPAPINLYADGAGALTIGKNGTAWVVAYAAVDAETVGGVQAYFSLSDATLHLDDWYPAAGCLSVAGNGAPLIGGPYFYLTSQPYPVEGSEWMAPNPNRNKPGQKSNFGFGDLWTLTQPFVTDGYMQSKMGVNIALVYGSEGSFSVTDQYMSAKGVYPLQANVFGTQGSFTVNDSGYMRSNCYILQGLLYGSEVDYSYGKESYLRSHITINSATVS